MDYRHAERGACKEEGEKGEVLFVTIGKVLVITRESSCCAREGFTCN